MRRAFETTAWLLLVGSIVLPTALAEIKAGLLLLATFLAIYLTVKEKPAILPEFAFFWAIYPVAGIAWSVYGLAMGNPGAVRVLTVMLAYPLVFPLLATCYQPAYDRRIYSAMQAAAWILVATNVVYLAGSLLSGGGAVVDAMQSLFGDNAVVDDGDDYFKFTLPNVPSLIFLIPFFLVALLSGFAKSPVAGVALILSMLAVGVLSGRRALLVTAALGPMLAYALTCGAKRDEHRSSSGLVRNAGISAALIFTALWLFYGFDRSEFYRDQLISVFDFSDNASNTERRLQFEALSAGWAESPIFGAGAGAAAGYSRSVEHPWAYELSYVAFLFQYGVVGFLLYSIGILYLVFRLRELVKGHGRDSIFYCVLAGFLSFLAANATNPYLAKFDFMWVLFLPFAMVGSRRQEPKTGAQK